MEPASGPMKPIQVSFEDLSSSLPWPGIEAFKPDLILAIARGGLVPAALIATRLGVPLASVRVSLYDDSKPAKQIHAEPELLGDLPNLKNKRVLIVDDVSKSGKTLETVRKLANANEASVTKTLVYAGKADFSARAFEMCLRFPWESRAK